MGPNPIKRSHFCGNKKNKILVDKIASLKCLYHVVYIFLIAVKKMVCEDMEKLRSPRVHLVVDAYTHALTAKCPHYRYLVGNDARIILRLLWNLPVWITDFILSANMKIPMAERSRNRWLYMVNYWWLFAIVFSVES